MERMVTADIDRLADLRFEAEEKISRLDDYVCRDILRLRYIEYRPWTEITSLGYFYFTDVSEPSHIIFARSFFFYRRVGTVTRHHLAKEMIAHLLTIL